jgi:hypothetical protein
VDQGILRGRPVVREFPDAATRLIERKAMKRIVLEYFSGALDLMLALVISGALAHPLSNSRLSPSTIRKFTPDFIFGRRSGDLQLGYPELAFHLSGTLPSRKCFSFFAKIG